MRFILLVISIIYFSSHYCFAQDIAVLNNGDTIRGKITAENSDFVFLISKKNNRHLKLPLTSLANWSKRYENDTLYKTVTADLILLINNDSIKAKNVGEGSGFYYFQSAKDNYIAEKKIPKTVVKSVKRGYFVEKKVTIIPSLANKKQLSDSNITGNNESFKHIVKLGLDIGYNYLTDKIPISLTTEQKQYLERLKNGLAINASISIFFHPNVGIGFDFLNARSSSSINYPIPNWYENRFLSNSMNFGMNETLFLNHYAGYLTASFNLNRIKNIKYVVNLGLTYLTYVDKLKLTLGTVTVDGSLKGNTVGVLFSNQIDFMITENFALSLRADYGAGLISKVSVTVEEETRNQNLEDNNRIDLSRLSFSTGLRYYIF